MDDWDEGIVDEGDTRGQPSHRHWASLRATRSFDSRFLSGASKKDTRPDWPKPKRIYLRVKKLPEQPS